ncbi:MAG: methionyl-tRNA formyltransferase, partial [Gemmobacter sp.]
MRVVFMGTPEFSVPALQALVAAGHEVAAVYTQPPRPAGRGQQLRPSPVQAEAERLGLPVRHPVRLREAAEQA